MASYSLGSISGRIQIDYDGSGVGKAKKDIDGLEKEATSKGKGMQNVLGDVGKGVTVAGLAIASGLALAVNAASDFEKELSGIKAVSGATAQEMDQIRDAALRIGKDTSFSASEAAKAMSELSKAGVSTSDILNGAADATVALAAAGGVDLPTAAEIAANALNLFNLEAKDMNNVVDKIAGAANKSAIDVGDFGYSMSQAGTAAALVGMSFDDMAVAITAMGNAGIKGSDAGTSLKTMLMNLQPATKDQIKLFDQLGITTNGTANKFFDAKGNVKSLADIGGVLETALKGMTKQQQMATLEVMFGSDAIRAAAVVAETGKKGFIDLGQAIGSISAADVAKTRLDNLAGSVEQLKGSLETAAIQMGTVLIPVIRKVTEWVTSLINWFSNLSPTMQKWITIGLAVAAALLLIVGAIIGLVTAFAAVKAVLVVAGIAFGAVMLIALKVILIIAAVAAVVWLIWKNWDTVSAFLKGIWDKIVSWAQAFANWFWSNFGEKLSALWTSIKEKAMAAWNALVPFFQQAWEKIKGLAQAVWPIIQAIIERVSAFMTTVWPPVLSIIKTIFGLIVDTFVIAWNLISGVVEAAWYIIKGIVLGIIDVFTGIINFIVGIFTGNWQLAWDGIVQIFSGVVTMLKGLLDGALTFIKTIWSAAGDILTSVWRAIWTTVGDVLEIAAKFVVGVVMGFVDAIKGFWKGLWDKAVEIFNGIVTTITNAFTKAQTWIVTTWTSIVQSIKNALADANRAVGEGIGKVIQWIKDLPGKAVDALGNLGSKLYESGKALISGFVRGIKDMASKVVQEVKDMLSKARNLLPFSPAKEGPFSGKGYTLYSGRALMTDFAKGIGQAAPKLRSTLQSSLALAQAELSPSMAATRIEQLRAPSSGLMNLHGQQSPGMYTQDGSPWNITVNNNNPVAETGTESTVRSLNKLRAFGMFP